MDVSYRQCALPHWCSVAGSSCQTGIPYLRIFAALLKAVALTFSHLLDFQILLARRRRSPASISTLAIGACSLWICGTSAFAATWEPFGYKDRNVVNAPVLESPAAFCAWASVTYGQEMRACESVLDVGRHYCRAPNQPCGLNGDFEFGLDVPPVCTYLPLDPTNTDNRRDGRIGFDARVSGKCSCFDFEWKLAPALEPDYVTGFCHIRVPHSPPPPPPPPPEVELPPTSQSGDTPSSGGGQICLSSDLPAGAQTPAPIIPATGEKQYDHTDYAGQGADPLRLVRSFRSSKVVGAATGVAAAGLGQTWAHNYSTRLVHEGTAGTAGNIARIVLGSGSIRVFAWDAETSGYQSSYSADTLAANIYQGEAGYLYTRRDEDSTWQFNGAGASLKVKSRNGWNTNYSYSTAATPISVAPVPGLLVGVNNQFGKALSFAYNASSQLLGVTTPDGQVISYGYDGTNAAARLVSVTYPASNSGGVPVTKSYLYEDANFPQLVTGIIDENGARLATVVYDSLGRAIESGWALGVDRYTVAYGANSTDPVQVTDPLGTARSYRYGTAQGKLVVTGADKPGGARAKDAASRLQDADNGFILEETDFLGVRTMYTWDINRRLPLTTTKAAGLPEAQTTTTQWHPSFRLPVLVTEAGRTTAYRYDAQGNKLSQTVTDTATNVARTISWTYNPQGLVATQSANSIVRQTYAYYTAGSFSGVAPNEVGHTAGDLQSATNAAGHATQFTLYDRAGRVRQMVDPKGIVTDMTYTPRGWVSSSTVIPPGGVARTTSYTYDNVGQLTGVIMPDSTTMSYSYDAAHRLTGVTDAKGNTVAYALDAMGNKVSEQAKDPQGNLQRNITRVYDNLNRVQQVTGASN